MRQNNIIFSFFLFCLISCDTSNDKAYLKLKEISKNSLSSYSNVIIIPGEGCSGCISDAGNFVKLNIEKLKRTLIIFTNIKDHKLLRLKMGRTLFAYPNVKTDTANLVGETKLLSLYPQLVEIKNGKIHKYGNFTKEAFTW
jgi:hypothetical protein